MFRPWETPKKEEFLPIRVTAEGYQQESENKVQEGEGEARGVGY